MHENLIDTDKYVFQKDGRIFSKYLNDYCKGTVNNQGYRVVSLSCTDKKRRIFKIHRVIGYFLIPKPEHLRDIPYDDLQIDHINTIKTDNRVSNLRWCTQKENHNNPLSIENHRLSNSRTFSDEAKKKMSLAKKGVFTPWNKGKHHSEETKKKISEMFKGQHHSPLTEFKKGAKP